MSNTNRSGPFSATDKDYIRNAVDKETVEDIAIALERNPTTIRKYIEDNRLGKKFEETVSASDRTQAQILAELRSRPFFKNLKKQFEDHEIEYFCEYWVMTVMDFGGNIMSYEELELKEWLTFEILKNRMLAGSKINALTKHTLKEELQNEFNKEPADRDKDRVKFIQAELNSIDEAAAKHNKEFGDLAYKADKIKSGLVKSREQRTKDLDTAKIDFSALIKILQTDYDAKKRMGEEMEIIRIAEEKKRKEMYQLETFADKELDFPILNAKTAEFGVNTEDS